MTLKHRNFVRTLGLVMVSLAWISRGNAQTQVINMVNAPRPFSIVRPASWASGPIVTGNTRASFVSLKKSTNAECSVIAVELKGQNLTQKEINQNIAIFPSAREAESELGRSYNNVKVISIGPGLLAGYPARVVKFEYSVGTPAGEVWGVLLATTAATVPNVVWTVGCGGLGKNLAEAKKAFSYWQSDINNFPTNFKLK